MMILWLGLILILTDKSLCDTTSWSLNSKVNSTHLRLVSWGTRWNWDLLDSIRAQIGDKDKSTTSSSIWGDSSCCSSGDLEWIWWSCGRLLPLNSTISLLSSDTVDISLIFKHLGTSKVVALYTSRNSSKVLDTVCRGSWNVGIQKSINLSLLKTYL